MENNFYCMKVCGDSDFSIEEWNTALKYCNDAGIEGVERDKILNPEFFPCKKQCSDCINEVLDRQLKTKHLIGNLQQKIKTNIMQYRESYHRKNKYSEKKNREDWEAEEMRKQGIENNNGWIKIESEEDLPKEDCECHIEFEDGSISIDKYSAKYKDFKSNSRIHIVAYKLIEQPKKRIY